MDSDQKSTAAQVSMGIKSNKANLTALTWAHAVNSQRQLTEALNGIYKLYICNIDFIEADIVLGKLNNTGADLPIMAHPPAKTSDLSLDSFLLQIKQYNDKHSKEMKKGIKLDFKSIEVFEGSLKTLQEKIPEMTYPIWLNADIVGGPVNQNVTRPVNPERFFAGCAPFEKAVLSIGWTTKWTTTVNNGSYTRKETNAMLEAIKNNNVTKTGQPITFPVRAGIAANSLNELHDLVKAVNATNECSLTIWSSQNDFVNIDKLRKLIFSFGFDRIYLDVPEEVSSKLNLWQHIADDSIDNNGGSKSLSNFFNFTLISLGMVLISLWLQKTHI
ncbi:protein FAM151B isoform 3-T7 [Cochliomyia hominivorax]